MKLMTILLKFTCLLIQIQPLMQMERERYILKMHEAVEITFSRPVKATRTLWSPPMFTRQAKKSTQTTWRIYHLSSLWTTAKANLKLPVPKSKYCPKRNSVSSMPQLSTREAIIRRWCLKVFRNYPRIDHLTRETSHFNKTQVPILVALQADNVK